MGEDGLVIPATFRKVCRRQNIIKETFRLPCGVAGTIFRVQNVLNDENTLPNGNFIRQGGVNDAFCRDFQVDT